MFEKTKIELLKRIIFKSLLERQHIATIKVNPSFRYIFSPKFPKGNGLKYAATPQEPLWGNKGYQHKPVQGKMQRVKWTAPKESLRDRTEIAMKS